MKLAILRTGNKQYKVKEGDKIKVEKLEAEIGATLNMDDVLLVCDGDKCEIGAPKLDTKIEVKVLNQAKADKVRVVKYKNKTRYSKTYGHRQRYTELEIVKI